jgi:hypothetical protein
MYKSDLPSIPILSYCPVVLSSYCILELFYRKGQRDGAAGRGCGTGWRDGDGGTVRRDGAAGRDCGTGQQTGTAGRGRGTAGRGGGMGRRDGEAAVVS